MFAYFQLLKVRRLQPLLLLPLLEVSHLLCLQNTRSCVACVLYFLQGTLRNQEAAHQSCQRKILGKGWKDKFTNEAVREKVYELFPENHMGKGNCKEEKGAHCKV